MVRGVVRRPMCRRVLIACVFGAPKFDRCNTRFLGHDLCAVEQLVGLLEMALR